MKAARLVAVIVVGAVAVGGAAVYKASARSSRGEAIRAEASQLVMASDAARKEPDYVQRLFEDSHAEAVSQAGSVLVGSSFSEERYYTALLGAMVSKAEAAQRNDLARSLRNFAVGRGFVDVKAR